MKIEIKNHKKVFWIQQADGVFTVIQSPSAERGTISIRHISRNAFVVVLQTPTNNVYTNSVMLSENSEQNEQ